MGSTPIGHKIRMLMSVCIKQVATGVADGGLCEHTHERSYPNAAEQNGRKAFRLNICRKLFFRIIEYANCFIYLVQPQIEYRFEVELWL